MTQYSAPPPSPPPFSAARAVVRLSGVTLWTLLLAVPHILLLPLGTPISRKIPKLYWTGVCRALRLRVSVAGTPEATRPALLVANHASYLDVLVLGSVFEACFVAKAEVARWPGINIIARLGRTIFVERKARHAGTQKSAISERLRRRDQVILFPEGTSNDGLQVLPFKSALFSVAEGDHGAMPIQPVTVAYTHLDGRVIDAHWRPHVAWFADMTLGPHLWRVVGAPSLDVVVTCHPPLTMAGCGTRKSAAAAAYDAVAAGLADTYRRLEPTSRTVDGAAVGS